MADRALAEEVELESESTYFVFLDWQRIQRPIQSGPSQQTQDIQAAL